MNKLAKILIPSFLLLGASFASADTIGQNEHFFVSSDYDVLGRAGVDATLRNISERAYFYVADEYWNAINDLARADLLQNIYNLGQEFDNRMYPIETNFFGFEPNPGIDGDSRITIFLAPLIDNAGGYFDTTNENPKYQVINSNQREMIFLNISAVNKQEKIFPFLAHEFQHLISYNQKEVLQNTHDDIWLNELRSEYATTLLGYNNVYEGSHLQRRVDAILSLPGDSLTEWKNYPADYGQITLFAEYLAQNFPSEIIADTAKNNLSGLNSLAAALIKNGVKDSTFEIYRRWVISNFINDQLSTGKFGYKNKFLSDMRVPPSRYLSGLDDDIKYVVPDSIKDWSGVWYDFYDLGLGTENILKISFDSTSLASFNISYLVFRLDGSYVDRLFSPTPEANAIYLSGMGTEFNRVLLMPIKKDKVAGFSSREDAVDLSTALERVSVVPDNYAVLNIDKSGDVIEIPTNPTLFPDGTLIRARGDHKVYVIRGGWRRHIIDARIFGFYKGLGFENVTEVDPDVLNKYRESDLVRYSGNQRVYSISIDGSKRWLDIGGDQFTVSGRSWDSIFEINNLELTFYKNGGNITK